MKITSIKWEKGSLNSTAIEKFKEMGIEFLAALEYLQYSDTEKCRKTVKKKEQMENNLYF